MERRGYGLNLRRVTDECIVALRYIFCLSVVAYYVLPNTIWSDDSPVGWLANALLNQGSIWSKPSTVMLTIICIVACIWRTSKLACSISHAALALCVITYTVSILATIIWSTDGKQVSGCERILIATLLGLLVGLAFGRPEPCIRVLVVISIIQSLYTLFYAHSGTHMYISGTVQRAGGTFDQPTSLYRLFVISIPLTAGLFIMAVSSVSSLCWSVGLATTFSALLLSYVRGGMIAVCVGLTCVVYRTSKSKFTAGFVCALVIASLAGVCYLRARGPHVNQVSSVTSALGRLSLFRRGWNIFLRHPLTGVGIAAVELPVVSRHSKHVVQVLAEPKNIYLLLLDEYGVFGAVLCVAAIASIRRIVIGSKSTIGYTILASWLSLAVAGLADTPFGTQRTDMGNLLVAALFGATLLLRPEKESVQ